MGTSLSAVAAPRRSPWNLVARVGARVDPDRVLPVGERTPPRSGTAGRIVASYPIPRKTSPGGLATGRYQSSPCLKQVGSTRVGVAQATTRRPSFTTARVELRGACRSPAGRLTRSRYTPSSLGRTRPARGSPSSLLAPVECPRRAVSASGKRQFGDPSGDAAVVRLRARPSAAPRRRQVAESNRDRFESRRSPITSQPVSGEFS